MESPPKKPKAGDAKDEGPVIISGDKIGKKVREEVATDVKALVSVGKVAPCLAVVLVGERKDSQTYVRMKTKACEEAGITGIQHTLPADVTEAKLLDLIKELNSDKKVNGILVQLPLPAHINQDIIIQSIDPNKDVDGLHDRNAGDVFKRGLDANLIPCTPLGCMRLLKEIDYELDGKVAVVLGRSILVGKPLVALLQSRNATVIACHSRTKDLPSILKQADLVCAAIGKANFVKGEWLKPGAVVIDVGINSVEDKSRKLGYRLVGDVNFESAKAVASAITPVPGGVGPMTVAMLLRNTVKAYHLQNK